MLRFHVQFTDPHTGDVGHIWFHTAVARSEYIDHLRRQFGGDDMTFKLWDDEADSPDGKGERGRTN